MNRNILCGSPVFRAVAVALLALGMVGAAAAADPPEANFIFEPQSPYVGESVSFDASGSTPAANISQYTWNFGDGTTGVTGITPPHTFHEAGEVTVILVVRTTDEQTSQQSRNIVVRPLDPPVVSSVAPNNGYQGEPKDVTITGQNFGDFESAWLEKSGIRITLTSAAASSPTTVTGHLQIPDDAQTGVWTVYVTTAAGTSGTGGASFSVLADDTPPSVTAVFPTSLNQGATGASITVSGANFRDNAQVRLTKTGQTPIEVSEDTVDTEAGQITGTIDISSSALAGDWRVVVENSDGTVSDEVVTLTINEVGPMTISSLSPSSGYLGQTITCSIMGANLRNGVPVLKLGGETITMNVANSADGQLSGTFTISASATTGWYDLRITNSATGAEVIDESAFNVLTEPDPEPPEADFTFSPTNPEVGEEVSFTDTSDGDPDDWEWDFGDNSGEDVQNPDHTYSSAGTYTVELTVSNDDGEDTVTHTITVLEEGATPTPTPGDEDAPEASFTVDRTRGMAPLVVSFTDTSEGEVDEWFWDFGDGGESTQENPTHTYSFDGEWLASLTVKNSGGSDTATKWITVGVEALEASFTASRTSGTAPLTVTFSEESAGDPDSYEWDFDNGQTYPAHNPPSITYTSPGTYDVTLTVTEGEDTDTKTVRITVTSPTTAATATPAATAKALSSGAEAGDAAGDGDIVSKEYGKLTGLYNEYLRYVFGLFGWEPPETILIVRAGN
ncbi:hypothetical protein AZH53_08835 [Methanomicrobiaceae archaeon CYW5]|uniref:PKD domain-containing protein n=1 Tax=Methanovulcanius yangii TaxID=1789227 RepID=UPI0029CA83CC|nr:PKD domain-containing protein [Methanovulcanius yangii]MBT8508510.1 hypothetical protein [Methanovulcanius yangii]